MGPATAIKTGFAKSFQFKGRASRSEFWWFALFVFAANVGGVWLVLVTVRDGGTYFPSLLISMSLLLLAISFWAAGTRRTRDVVVNRSRSDNPLFLLPFALGLTMAYFQIRFGFIAFHGLTSSGFFLEPQVNLFWNATAFYPLYTIPWIVLSIPLWLWPSPANPHEVPQ